MTVVKTLYDLVRVVGLWIVDEKRNWTMWSEFGAEYLIKAKRGNRKVTDMGC